MGKRALSVFLILAGAYLATSSFRVETIDTAVRLEVARSLVREGSAAIAPLEMRTPFGVVGSFLGRGGRHYAVYGIGQSLLMVPGVALGGPSRDAALVTLINPLAVAATGALLVLIGGRLGYSASASGRAGLLFGLGTLAWPQAVFTFEAPLELLAGTAALHALLGGGPRAGFAAGAAFGFALLVRPSAFVMAPALAWLLVGQEDRLRRGRDFLLAASPFVAGALLYNAARWGSPLATGYAHTEFRYVALSWEGLVGLLVSPGRGFFWFSPVLLLAFAGWPALRRRAPRAAAYVILLAVSYVAFLSCLTVWNGDWTWGPRHLLPVVPAVTLALLPLLEPGALRKAVAAPLVAVSVAVQLVGATMNYEVYYLWHNQWMRETGQREAAGRVHFSLSRSQLHVQARQAWMYFSELGARMASYRPERDGDPYASVLGGSAPITKRVPDVWWVYFPLVGVPGPLSAALAAACAGLLGAGIALGRRAKPPMSTR